MNGAQPDALKLAAALEVLVRAAGLREDGNTAKVIAELRRLHALNADAESDKQAAVATERERLIAMVLARAQSHNGPHVLTLELNQLAAWMAGKDWHGIRPPAVKAKAQP